MREINWPSREEWAAARREAAGEPYMQVDLDLAKYATPDEVAQIIATLLAEREALLEDLATAKVGAPHRRPGETKREWHRRLLALSFEDQARAAAVEHIIDERARRSAAIKCLQDGFVPWVPSEGGDLLAVAVLVARVQSAYDAEVEEALSQLPIDDAAWEQELERRKMVEAGGMVIHRIA